MSNPTLAAARRQLDQLRQAADGFDKDLALLQRHEQDGEPLLPALTGARVLIALADLGAQLEEQRDALTEALGDLPDLAQSTADAAGGAPR